MINYLLSFSIYTLSEIIYNIHYHKNDYILSTKRILLSTFIDTTALKNFHKLIDTYKLNPFQKMIYECLLFSPFSTSSFLLLNHNFTFHNWTSIYTNDLLYWSINSTISYKYFTNKNRFVYISFCSFVYSNYRLNYFTNNNS